MSVLPGAVPKRPASKGCSPALHARGTLGAGCPSPGHFRAFGKTRRDPTFIWKMGGALGSILRMFKLLVVGFSLAAVLLAADLPTRKQLNLATIKIMVAAAEAEAQKRNVEVSICIVDESGNLLFFEKADAASLNTIDFARKKARHAALYRSPSREGAEALKKGNLDVLAFPDFFPNQGGLPIQVDGQTIGGIAASGARSEIDEAIAQAGLDAAFKKP
jgi:glc operon protein GlcG